MKGLREKFRKHEGFTLVEMLIVVAIIAILIAVSIPLVTSALEKARDATDQANERAAKAEGTLVYMQAVDSPAADKSNTGTFYYDAEAGKLVTGTEIEPYGKCTGKDDCYKGDKKSHDKQIIQVEITEADGTIAISWVASTKS